jgi:TP901-1 family phage major tail protein
MAAQRGKDLLLRVESAPAVFTTIGGLRARQISFNSETVDTTHAESTGRWRELLDGAGVRRASISGAGVFKDEASDVATREIFFTGDIREWQVIMPDFGRIQGRFQITSLEYRGEHTAEVTFEIALESAGALSFTAL